jgi:integrase
MWLRLSSMRGSIQERNGKWRLVVDAGTAGVRHQRVRTVVGTRQHAELELARFLVEVGRGEVTGHNATVGQLLDAWLNVARLAVSTRRDYGYARQLIPPTILATPVWKLRAAPLDALYADLAKRGLGPDRIRRVHGLLRRAFVQAVKWGWVARNPILDASPPPAPAPRPKPPTVAEVGLLLAAAPADLVAFLRLEAGLGARRGELCALQWRDFDLDAGTVIVRRALADGGVGIGVVVKLTKTENERTVALDGATVAVLRDHRRACAEKAMAVGVHVAPTAYVFSSDADGLAPWRPDSTTRRFIRLRRRVARSLAVASGITDDDMLDAAAHELDHIKLRDLRHFVATQMLAAGIDPRTVSGRLGHARTSTTLDIYAGFVPARDRDAADILGRLLGGSAT